MNKLRTLVAAWSRQTAGAAAVELALVLLLLLLPTLNLVDFAVYAFSRNQVEEAAQMGAQEGWTACNGNTPGRQPATNSGLCPSFANAVTHGVQSTFLGSHVSVAGGYPSEGFYCATATGGLTLVGTAGTVGSPPVVPNPDTCDAVAGHSAPAGTKPADYVQVAVTYTYAPLFTGISIVSLLNTSVTKTAWTRLD